MEADFSQISAGEKKKMLEILTDCKENWKENTETLVKTLSRVAPVMLSSFLEVFTTQQTRSEQTDEIWKLTHCKCGDGQETSTVLPLYLTLMQSPFEYCGQLWAP